MGYANLEAAAQDLGLSFDDPNHANELARLAEIDDTVAAQIDQRFGRSFGGVAVESTRFVPLPSRPGFTWLSLPRAIRSVSAIDIAGDYAATLALTDWVLANPTEQSGDYHAVQRIDGGTWPSGVDGRSTVAITGLWSDQADGETVPDLVQAAATFIVVEEYKLRRSNENGEIGLSDGMTVRARNPWKFQVVQDAQAAYGAAKSRAMY